MKHNPINQRCLTCHHARQIGDKSRQDVVACAKLTEPSMKMKEVENSDLYEGYAYLNRKVGDVGEAGYGNVARSCLTLSVITDDDGWCKNWTKYNW